MNIKWFLSVVPVLALVIGACLVASAFASVASAPSLRVTTVASPTVLPAGLGKEGHYSVIIENVGGASTTGEITLKDVLPPRFTTYLAVHVEPEYGPNNEPAKCNGTSGEIKCGIPATLVPGGFAVVNIYVKVTGSSGSLANIASVSGGGAPEVTDETSMRAGVEGETAPPGVSLFKFEATGPAGEPFTQAGGHPQFLTASVLFNDVFDEGSSGEYEKPVEDAKDLVFYLPLGLLGDPVVTEPCPASLVEVADEVSGCPPASRVGTILASLLSTVNANSPDPTHERAIYNVVPEKGYAAEFAFTELSKTFFIYANVVRHDGAYMLRMTTPGITPGAHLLGLIATFKGDISETYSVNGGERTHDDGAFLTDPTDCEEGPQPREASVAFNTWEHPESEYSQSVSAFPTLEGCGLLGFSASLSAAPDTTVSGDTMQADEPSGYKVDVGAPQAPNGGSGLGTPPYKSVEATFPEGTTLSPGAANGLTACPASGPDGIDIPPVGGELPTGAAVPGEEAGEGEAIGQEGLPRPVAGHCPSSSQIGTARASTPLLHEELEGHLYLAEPECGNSAHPNPCTPEDAANGSLYRLYLELEAPNRGVIIKLPGKALVNPTTGQVKNVFEDTPQFPVSNLVVETTGGPRAVLANPQSCGTATTTGLITPWSAPSTLPVSTSSSFNVTGCAGASPFTPSFTAGTTSPAAGSYSPFTLTLKREDREQNGSSISMTLPEGLLASVKNVAQCPEPQASVGGCSAGSEVGTATVGVGSGPGPYNVTGHVYFTGPYNGAPFGLSVLVPAVAGPFNLGNVIVRVALSINPSTAQVTATSSPLPQIIDGVPLRIRTIGVTLSGVGGQSDFTFNPTYCSQLSITGTVSSTSGTTANVSSPFAAANCKSLPFKPVFSASTAGKASKAGGASLIVKVTSKGGPQTAGEEANIRSVKVDLPKQLPSRLTTLQKACTAAQFESNPAGCPKESDVGTATAVTPILAHPLIGPAYLVSHGNEAFPDLEIVLQGEGVKLVLDGNTDIKKGITSSTFKTVPDAPISSFELKLPVGKFSVLGANVPVGAHYSLCGQALKMPTEITGQNGVVVKQATKVGVTGCPKIKKAKNKRKKKKRERKRVR